jgi:hypothetical protein
MPKKALSTHCKNQVPLLLFSTASVPDSTNQFDECLVTSYVDFPYSGSQPDARAPPSKTARHFILKAEKNNAESQQNCNAKNPFCSAYRRTPGVPTGVLRFIMGGLTTADFVVVAVLGAGFLLAKNLCARASFGDMRFSTFMCRLALNRSARSFNSLAVGPPLDMFRAASWTLVFMSRLILFCCSILRTESCEKISSISRMNNESVPCCIGQLHG